MESAGERDRSMSSNFGDFQLRVYADVVKGVNSRYPFDFRSIERKASEALPDWVYRYVSAAAGDGRTQQANVDAYSHYGIIPRMMVSRPERDLSMTFSPSILSRRSSCARSAWSACARPIFRVM
jgi:FMN-dependent dehydrogenase